MTFILFSLQEKGDENDENKNENDVQSKGPKPSDWRHGPAQYWYDMMNLPEKVEDFDYNLKMAVDNIPQDEQNVSKDEKVTPLKEQTSDESKIEFPPDAFLMVTQVNWEEDVIWNGDDIKHKVNFVYR